MTDTNESERRKPGRPSNAELAARGDWNTKRDGFVSTRQTAEAERPTRGEEIAGRRRRREGLGAERGKKLHIPEESKDPNFVYRWVNDRGGRVRQLTQMDDYEVVSSSELNGGDPDPTGNTAEGTVMKRTADSGIGESAVLLKKPREYYEADKKEEQKAIDARDEAMRRGPPPSSQDGLTNKDNAYVPGGRNIVGGR